MVYKGITIPENLREQALKFIKNIIDTFQKENKLNGLDSMAIYMLANNFNDYLACEEDIKTNGYTIVSDRGNTSLSPYVVMMKTIQSQIAVLLKELGLTLGSRNKLKVVENLVEESPLASFIKQNG